MPQNFHERIDAMRRRERFRHSFKPESLATEVYWLCAVMQDGEALEKAPAAFRTRQVCLTAVQENGDVLKFVPEACSRDGNGLRRTIPACAGEPL